MILLATSKLDDILGVAIIVLMIVCVAFAILFGGDKDE